MQQQTIAIAGAGQAGFQVATSLRQFGFDGRIFLIGNEPGLPYQRPPLSKKFVTGGVTDRDLVFRDKKFFEDQHIELIDGVGVQDIDGHDRCVSLSNGQILDFDHLVLALGARNRAVSIDGSELDGIFSLRTRADAQAIRDRLRPHSQVVVVGAGFVGLEFAACANQLGAEVQVIELANLPMRRGVSAMCSQFFLEQHRLAGIGIHVECGVREFLGTSGQVTGVVTTDGQYFPADIVLIGAGAIPNTELATQAGLRVEDGIVVNADLVTTNPLISAVGDCARFPSPFALGLIRLESVQNAIDHARRTAARLSGAPMPAVTTPWFWSDQGNFKLQIVGLNTGYDETVTRGDAITGELSFFCFRNGELIAIESVNRPTDHMRGRRHFAAGSRLAPADIAEFAIN